MVKVYLSRKGIPFTEHNVSIDENARQELLSRGCSTTPVTLIGDQMVMGYKPRDIDQALAAAG